tara:strand:- start:677 stop:1153 length:477 start_codon:yes stop_codon:yes gene_type:complete
MAIHFRTFEFTDQNYEDVTALLRDNHQVDKQNYWVNIEPAVEEAEVHSSSLFWKMFSSRGPVIPKFTWVPSYEKKQELMPAQIGITHPVGTKAVQRLRDFEVRVPPEWVVHQDHPKRGIVLSLPEIYSEEEVIHLATRSLRVLSPFDFGGNFLASVTI